MLTTSRWLSLVSYFCLLGVVLAWNAWIQPPQLLPRALVLILLITPLLFPLRGLLHGKAYTHAWTSFLALFYFSLGVSAAANADSRLYGALQIIASVLLFVGCILYARLKGRLDKQMADISS